MRKTLLSKVMLGAVVGALAAISGLLGYETAQLLNKEAERKTAKAAADAKRE